MAQLTIRKVPDKVVRALKIRATQQGRSAEAELRLILQEAAFRLSLELKHPVYDCLYLVLAAKRDVPLATADRRLAAAVRKRRKPAPQAQLLDDLSQV